MTGRNLAELKGKRRIDDEGEPRRRPRYRFPLKFRVFGDFAFLTFAGKSLYVSRIYQVDRKIIALFF